ncbi:radical SAM protein [bacterium]|nr:radical SAM protein [bacterium]
MKKMVFIEPKAPNLHIFSRFTLPRLGCFILATLMQKRGWQADVIVEENEEIDFSRIQDADLVGISTITSTAPRAYAIADILRSKGIPVIMGGPHVTFLPGEALEHCDFVVRGEGEQALTAFVDQWEGKRAWEAVPNLSFRKDGNPIHTQSLPLIQDLDAVAVPDAGLLQKSSKSIAGKRVIPVQTSRGCPFNCTFCSVTGMFGKKFRYRSKENILAELRHYDSSKNEIFFYDDNFTANRSRAKALLRAMIREGFRFTWSTQVRADIAKDRELVELMYRAGCRIVYIGFESVNPESLEAMHKSQTVAEMREAVKVLRKQKINIHGMFVYGFDTDSWKTVKATVRFAKRMRLMSTQFLILTPLPGSGFYRQLEREGRIVLNDWNLYDAHHAVFRPSGFTMAELQRAQIYSHTRFYSFWESVKKLIQWRWADLIIAIYARGLNRGWIKKNRTFLKVIDLMTPRKGARISVDYHEEVFVNY